MPDAEQTHTAWLTEQHRHAQASAVIWAQQAEAAHKEAIDKATYARDKADLDYLRSQVARARQEAQTHGALSTEAARLAEMWAHVATALTPPLAPANGQPATYDLHFTGDPTAIQQALDTATAAARTARRHGSTP